jgi:hypothetical protein
LADGGCERVHFLFALYQPQCNAGVSLECYIRKLGRAREEPVLTDEVEAFLSMTSDRHH